MEIVLTHGYFIQDDPKEQVIMKPYPPLGILYIAAWLEKHGVPAAVFDTTFSSKAELKQYLVAQRPGMVAFYVNLMTKLNVIELVKWIRIEPALAHTKIVLGGPDVTHNAADYLRSGADFVAIGEGEQTMLELVWAQQAAVAQGLPLAPETIDGLAFLSEGQLVKTPPRAKMKSLEGLPWPDRAKIDLNLYLRAWKKAHGHSAISVSTQRGCPYTCKWCSTAVYGQSYRRRSPDDVVDEIAFLKKNYDFDLIWFVDDVFTVSHKWLEEFHESLRVRGLRIQFECITRADRLSVPVLQTLKDCGCFRVWIGAESGSQRVIDAMDRRVDVRQVRDMIQAARAVGIEAGTFIMLGYPGETQADIEETVAHLKESNPHLFTITVAYPIKGTGLYEAIAEVATAELPWDQRTDREVDFPRTYSRRYYDFAVRWTVNSVLFHQKKLAGKGFSWEAFKLAGKTMLARAGMAWHKAQSAESRKSEN